jgi:hypothetical protein
LTGEGKAKSSEALLNQVTSAVRGGVATLPASVRKIEIAEFSACQRVVVREIISIMDPDRSRHKQTSTSACPAVAKVRVENGPWPGFELNHNGSA